MANPKTRGPDVPGLGRDYRVSAETNARLEAMSDELQITLDALIELGDRHGLEIVGKQARATDERPGGHL